MARRRRDGVVSEPRLVVFLRCSGTYAPTPSQGRIMEEKLFPELPLSW